MDREIDGGGVEITDESSANLKGGSSARASRSERGNMVETVSKQRSEVCPTKLFCHLKEKMFQLASIIKVFS